MQHEIQGKNKKGKVEATKPVAAVEMDIFESTEVKKGRRKKWKRWGCWKEVKG